MPNGLFQVSSIRRPRPRVPRRTMRDVSGPRHGHLHDRHLLSFRVWTRFTWEGEWVVPDWRGLKPRSEEPSVKGAVGWEGKHWVGKL